MLTMKTNLDANERIFPNPALVVCTYDEAGVPNAATLAWGGVASSHPQSVSIAVRPSRYTFDALVRNRAFTLNLPSVQHVAEVDYFGMVSGRDAHKFDVTGLTPVRGDVVNAPYIEEFPFSMECVVTHAFDLRAHTLFIGEIKNIKIDEDFVGEKGMILWEKAGILTYDSGQRVYRAPGEAVGDAFSIGKKFMGE